MSLRLAGTHAPQKAIQRKGLMQDDAVPMPLTPAQVQDLCGRGVAPDRIVRLLVATGTWSEAGAAEIVTTLSDWYAEPDPEPSSSGWPGPPEDPPPLFAA